MARVTFVGSKSLGLSCLRAICKLDRASVAGVVTCDDTSDGRSVLGKFREFAAEWKLPIVVAANRTESECAIRDVRPDLCLVVGWYWIISNETLAQVPRGLLGIHNSLLPRYRGCAPLVWAMINGEPRVGISLFSLTERPDQGGVWAQRAVDVQFDDHIGKVLQKIEGVSIELIHDVWPSIVDGALQPVPQDHSQATFGALRTPEDGHIDWRRSAVDVYNYIRAQSEPYPGAYTSITGEDKLTIWRARPLDVCCYGTPGQVAGFQDASVFVACGDNRAILVQEVSQDDGPRMSARAVLRSMKVRLRDLSDGARRRAEA
jgi:methionyl-tRNA formyltransferase